MNFNDIEYINDRYNKLFKQHGYDPVSVGWPKNQRLRFSVIYDLLKLVQDGLILDVGCGFGDFAMYLQDKTDIDFRYLGIDINDNFIEEGRKQFPGLNLHYGDISTLTIDTFNQNIDWCIASGTFNHKLPYSDTEDYVNNSIMKMFEIAKKGIVFNFMSDGSLDFKNEITNYISPVRMVELAKTLSKKYVLRHDYMPYEATVAVYK
ncbi:MAG: hypothetical protein A2163_00805 [Actinobacteria bacterium RBG_13_35_12]|nr:MAG: hypothetical protein A2163_00805 [Actinobacteria bacterium RBG_13_35_12]